MYCKVLSSLMEKLSQVSQVKQLETRKNKESWKKLESSQYILGHLRKFKKAVLRHWKTT